jgi:hypothetical protein
MHSRIKTFIYCDWVCRELCFIVTWIMGVWSNKNPRIAPTCRQALFTYAFNSSPSFPHPSSPFCCFRRKCQYQSERATYLANTMSTLRQVASRENTLTLIRSCRNSCTLQLVKLLGLPCKIFWWRHVISNTPALEFVTVRELVCSNTEQNCSGTKKIWTEKIYWLIWFSLI